MENLQVFDRSGLVASLARLVNSHSAGFTGARRAVLVHYTTLPFICLSLAFEFFHAIAHGIIKDKTAHAVMHMRCVPSL